MGEDVTKRLREQVASMTTRDWLVRVSELQQAVESRERVIEEQRRTIARLRELLDELRAKEAPRTSAPEPPQVEQIELRTRNPKGTRSRRQPPENS